MKADVAPPSKSRSVIQLAPLQPGPLAEKCKEACRNWQDKAALKAKASATDSERKQNEASVAQIGGMVTHLGGNSARERIVCVYSDKVAGVGAGDVHLPTPDQSLYLCKVNLEGRKLRLAEIVANPTSKGGGLGDLFLWASDQKRTVTLDAATIGLVDYYGRFGFKVAPSPKANHVQPQLRKYDETKTELNRLRQMPASAETTALIKELEAKFADLKYQQIDLAMEAAPDDIKAKVTETSSYQPVVEEGGAIDAPATPQKPVGSFSAAAAAASGAGGGSASLLASIKKTNE